MIAFARDNPSDAAGIPLNVEKISSTSVRVYTVPTDAPEADGTISWNSTTMVLVELAVGDMRGIGYTYADASTAKAAEHLLKTLIAGADPLQHPAIWMQLQRAVRNLGNRGIAAMAISAIDIALWDLRAKLLHVPLIQLLGAARESIPAYGSGGFTSYDDRQLESQLGGWAEKGFFFVKMKVGTHPEDDPAGCSLRARPSAIAWNFLSMRMEPTRPNKPSTWRRYFTRRTSPGSRSQSAPTILPASPLSAVTFPHPWKLLPENMATRFPTLKTCWLQKVSMFSRRMLPGHKD